MDTSKGGFIIRLSIECTLFYLDWIEPHLSTIRQQIQGSSFWLSKTQSAGWKSWGGLAFEAVCSKHVAQIRHALSIEPGSEIGSWRYVPRSKENKKGAQIDLLFDQPSGVVTLCEIKHSERPFIIDKDYAEVLRQKIEIYEKQTRTRKKTFLAMITSGGLKPSKYSKEMVSQEVCLDDLFNRLS